MDAAPLLAFTAGGGGLDRLRRQHGWTWIELAARLDLTADILVQIDRRIIPPARACYALSRHRIPITTQHYRRDTSRCESPSKQAKCRMLAKVSSASTREVARSVFRRFVVLPFKCVNSRIVESA